MISVHSVLWLTKILLNTLKRLQYFTVTTTNIKAQLIAKIKKIKLFNNRIMSQDTNDI